MESRELGQITVTQMSRKNLCVFVNRCEHKGDDMYEAVDRIDFPGLDQCHGHSS